jgi:hypothetical protein
MQTIEAFLVYTLLMVVVPAILFHRRMAGKPLGERLMAYITIGNFYCMNLVFILELLHISNYWTLMVFTLVPIVAFSAREHGEDIAAWSVSRLEVLQKAVLGMMGWKTLLSHIGRSVGGWLKAKLRKALHDARAHLFDWIFIIFLTAALLWLYGTNVLVNYSYAFSDVPVHNYWINSLGDNNIFVAGVYPFGFHCVIYYMHTMFRMDTYVLLRVFGVTQLLYIHLMLFIFMKGICKSRYSAYIGIIVYSLFNVFYDDCTSRFLGPLPQEYGMIFILPGIYFAWRFLNVRCQEIKSGIKGRWTASTWYLAGFAANFGMTLSVHFYDTMIAGLFCVALALAYIYRVLNPKYLGRIVLAVLAALFVSILPMGIAVACGKPLEGSLRWGLSIINASNVQEGDGDGDMMYVDVGEPETLNAYAEPETENATRLALAGATVQAATTSQTETTQASSQTETTQAAATSQTETAQAATTSQAGTSQAAETQAAATQGNSDARTQPATRDVGNDGNDGSGGSSTGGIKSLNVSIFGGANRSHSYIYRAFSTSLRESVFKNVPGGYFDYVVLGLAIMGVAGLVMSVLKQREYGGMLIAVVIFNLLMYVVLASTWFGIPALMEPARACIYVAYGLAVTVGLCADVLCAVVKMALGWELIPNLMSLAMLVGVVALGAKCGLFRTEPRSGFRFETNGAITCLTNILHDYEDETWTIVSANDELRMIDGRGYHYEPITFLQEMQSGNEIRIDTTDVFVYIEKIPLDYSVGYWGSGQTVSEEGASRELPVGTGLTAYKGENRWIVMSKMMKWAESFSRLYPYDMQVYYEDDEFICYHIKQNMYSLYNLNIGS